MVTFVSFGPATILIASVAAGALLLLDPRPPAKLLTIAAMMIVTTSISITPTTGETASSFTGAQMCSFPRHRCSFQDNMSMSLFSIRQINFS